MMTQKQLENYLWGAATLLRGVIDAGDYKQYIFPLIFFKRICDVYDEEYEKALRDSDGDLEYAAFAENHRFVVPEGSHWNNVREITSNVGMALQKAMQEIEKANPDVLYGIFGDAQWTNKQRLSDEILINLIEHFSSEKLTIANVPDDKLGDAYEFLIKKFADDSGHTAAEFYTNRTVVHLMTRLMDPKPGESVYDPTCGSGGLLLNCALELKKQGKEYRTLKLYGQEINLMTSSIARMNMFLHGIEDFSIKRGDTLKEPLFLENDRLKKFNVILANPPYSIKRWDRKMFENDPYGRNILGTPPQGRADYAFQQHILKSLDEKSGRSCVLWPFGILFRDDEKIMRKKMIESDIVEAVIALGANLFYNSSMESCLLICRKNKSTILKDKIMFIDARLEVKKDKSNAILTDEHIEKITNTYINYRVVENFSIIIEKSQIKHNDWNLNIPLYIDSVRNSEIKGRIELPLLISKWLEKSEELKKSINTLL